MLAPLSVSLPNTPDAGTLDRVLAGVEYGPSSLATGGGTTVMLTVALSPPNSLVTV